MILGIGIDIIDIPRVKRIAEEYGDDFVLKLFSEIEIAYCRSKKNPEINFAARFAAKEAFLKALGSGLRGGIDWKDIQVINDDLGKPFIFPSGRAERAANKIGVAVTHLSISHTADYAAAVVVLED
jgi:holo-[acyl-carrier protein] synthase